MEGGDVKVDPRAETKRARAMWGTSRTLVANLVTGVTKGFERRLEITGVGYRAALQGKNLQLQLGYSHDIVYPIPEGITIVGAEGRPRSSSPASTGRRSDRSRPRSAPSARPSPTRARACKYAGEYIFRKEGKKK